MTTSRRNIRIPNIIQMDGVSCGPAVVQGVLAYYGHYVYQSTLREQLKTDDEGTTPEAIVATLDHYGLEAEKHSDVSLEALFELVDRKYAIIACYQAWGYPDKGDYVDLWEDGHYGIVIGYNKKLIFIEDPSIYDAVGYMTHEDFLERWHDVDGEGEQYKNTIIVARGQKAPSVRRKRIE